MYIYVYIGGEIYRNIINSNLTKTPTQASSTLNEGVNEQIIITSPSFVCH